MRTKLVLTIIVADATLSLESAPRKPYASNWYEALRASVVTELLKRGTLATCVVCNLRCVLADLLENCVESQTFDVNLALAGQLGNDFIEQLSALREIDPIHWSDASHCWIVTRHADVDAALKGQFPLSNKRLVQVGLGAIAEADRVQLLPNMMRYMPAWIIDADPPAHTRLRKLLVKALSRSVVEAVRPFARSRVSSLLEELEREPEIEFNERIARQLPGSVILSLIGLPQEHLTRLRGWANAMQEGVGVPFANITALRAADAAMADMNRVLAPELEERRSHPRDDLLTALLQATDEEEKLSVDEMLGALHVLIIAGHDTTSNTLSLGLATLARHPEVWDYLYRHPDHALNTCLEIMRFNAMSTSQPRLAADDFEWHGKHIKRGDIVFLMLAVADRDPRAFAQPNNIDPRRSTDSAMVFGPGLHHCIGHLLAKMQVTEFFGAMVQRFEGATILDDPLHYMPQVVFRGVYDLQVRMNPRGR
jgi:pimeloyl-[acyl-carrier protein] synthase